MGKILLALTRIAETAKVWGVSITLDYDGESIHIPDLYRHKSHGASKPGDGMGVVRQVLHIGDMFSLPVEIEHMADEPKLGELYSRLGFEVYADGDVVGMRRKPGAATSILESEDDCAVYPDVL